MFFLCHRQTWPTVNVQTVYTQYNELANSYICTSVDYTVYIYMVDYCYVIVSLYHIHKLFCDIL